MYTLAGDFHFLWECLRVIYHMFWGTPTQSGSLCNLRELIRCVQVDKGVKVFNLGDEFLLHTFEAHLITGVLTQLKLNSVSDNIVHLKTHKWLYDTAQSLAETLLMPQKLNDGEYYLHSCFLHHAFLYTDLREAIRWEDGPQIIRHWKLWLPSFFGYRQKAVRS